MNHVGATVADPHGSRGTNWVSGSAVDVIGSKMDERQTVDGCVFCELIQGDGPFMDESEAAVTIVPLRPVTEGHLLIIPRQHAQRIYELDPDVLGHTIYDVAAAVSAYAVGGLDTNVIQSNGEAATQTVQHVHFHIVPRRPGDGLRLPWTELADGKPTSNADMRGITRCWQNNGWHVYGAGPCFDTYERAIVYRQLLDSEGITWKPQDHG